MRQEHYELYFPYLIRQDNETLRNPTKRVGQVQNRGYYYLTECNLFSQ
jgi:hypothetical protein